MKIILHDQDGQSLPDILGLRAAQTALREGWPIGDLRGIGFEDGSYYGVKVTKTAVNVYPQRKED